VEEDWKDLASMEDYLTSAADFDWELFYRCMTSYSIALKPYWEHRITTVKNKIRRSVLFAPLRMVKRMVQKRIAKQKGDCFCAIVWGSAKKFYEEIAADIGAQYTIIYKKNIMLDTAYDNFIEHIYGIDETERWKVIIKKRLLSRGPHEVMIVLFEIVNPEYRIKSRNCSCLSSKSAELKRFLRKKYAAKMHINSGDMVVHIGDNPCHNAAILRYTNEAYGIEIGSPPPPHPVAGNNYVTNSRRRGKSLAGTGELRAA
jgi:hypothetical protein